MAARVRMHQLPLGNPEGEGYINVTNGDKLILYPHASGPDSEDGIVYFYPAGSSTSPTVLFRGLGAEGQLEVWRDRIDNAP